jgi:hypothetical protein
MRAFLPALLLACAWLAAPAIAGGMLKYTDSQGRMHFVQDIGQVPPEYRNQVEKQALREISVTGEGGEQSQDERVKAMQQRARKLERATNRSTPPPTRLPTEEKAHPLAGAPEPVKYDRECWWDGDRHRCKKHLRADWQVWNQANGGQHGKAVTRRKLD